MSQPGRATILILGGGFAGTAVAQGLVRLLPAEEDCEITLVDQNNFSLFTPMLTEVAGGEVEPSDVVAAIRSLSPRVTFDQARIQSIDAAKRSVTVSVGDEAAGIPQTVRTLAADHLVIALGSVTNFHGIAGLEEHSLTVKSIAEAEAIRDRAIALLERADEESDPARRRELLTFVVGGGGFSGVETMAALNDLVRGLVGRFPRVTPDDVRTVIAQPGPRLLPEIGEGLALYAQTELERRGVEVRLNTSVTGAAADYVEVKGPGTHEPRRIPARTLIWAGGVTPSPEVAKAGLELGRHHGIVVDGCCSVPGHPGIWALGDCAEVPQPGGKKTYAPTAQNATREGRRVAANIVAQMRGGRPQPFVYHPIGELALVGRRAGVASVYGVQLHGFVAWAMWRAIYLAKLPRTRDRLRVGLDWLLDLAFGRDLVALPGPAKQDDTR